MFLQKEGINNLHCKRCMDKIHVELLFRRGVILKIEDFFFRKKQISINCFLTDFSFQIWGLAERRNKWVSYSIITRGFKLDLHCIDDTQPFPGILTHPHFKKLSVERNVDSGRIEYDWKLIKESSVSLPCMPGHNHLALNCSFLGHNQTFLFSSFPPFSGSPPSP